MSNAVLISKNTIDVDTQSIAIYYKYGNGIGSTTDTIIFAGLKTIEEIKIAIDAYGAGYYECSIIDDYIRIIAINSSEILTVTISGTNLSLIMGGAFTLNSAGINNYAQSYSWGIARIPFKTALKTTDRTAGGIKFKKPTLNKLSGEDYVGKNSVSSSKVIWRKGYDFTYRLDFIQLDFLQDFLEFNRLKKIKVLNGEDYNFIATDEWEILTAKTEALTDIYQEFSVFELQISILKC